MNSSNPADNGPAMSVRLRGGLIVTAPALIWMDQRRTLDLLESIYLNAPAPVPDDEWRETVGHLFEMSEARRPRDPELDELEHRLLIQQDLADRFVVAP